MLLDPRIFCAIDTDDLDRALQLVRGIAPVTGGVKLGMEFFNSHGPQGVDKVIHEAPEAALFIDLKFHDIPNTVAGAIRTLSKRFRPTYINVHASGGLDMMKAAKDACDPGVKLLAVTMLTSLDERCLHDIGYQEGLSDRVAQMALLAQEAGAAGVVCSSHEIQTLRATCGPEFVLMVPGIRPLEAERNDQKRVMTPQRAIELGASHLVIGRPITQADNPAEAAKALLNSF
ncbi:MAG: orotidine-5'-phosphate decarboxylase [Alphaproteobacteria bacterium]|nr:orotidine-5'-phosphate decarboxylase [Alphaproteobacteria bacterium]MCD8519786.1 orotidine-5'-phosphate decarboxylase [Alphaproteobacteria bacterium]MCD8570339.1 orotidine-5'-phosphate decarboxylase [Alphaproteobacteria bacterium]